MSIISYTNLSKVLTGSPNKIRKGGTKFAYNIGLLEKHVDKCVKILKTRTDSLSNGALNQKELDAKNREFRKMIIIDLFCNYLTEEDKETIKNLTL